MLEWTAHLRVVQAPADLLDADTPVEGDPPAPCKVALRHRIEQSETLETLDARAHLICMLSKLYLRFKVSLKEFYLILNQSLILIDEHILTTLLMKTKTLSDN